MPVPSLDAEDLADLQNELSELGCSSMPTMRVGKPPNTVELKINLSDEPPPPTIVRNEGCPARFSTTTIHDTPPAIKTSSASTAAAQHASQVAHRTPNPEAPKSVVATSSRPHHGTTGVDITWGGVSYSGRSVSTDDGKIGIGNQRTMKDRMWLGKGPPEKPVASVVPDIESSDDEPEAAAPLGLAAPLAATQPEATFPASGSSTQRDAYTQVGGACANAPQEYEEEKVNEEEDEECAWSPGSQTGRQGSDLMSAKKSRQSQSPPRERLGASIPPPASPLPATLSPCTGVVSSDCVINVSDEEVHSVHYHHEARTTQPVCMQLWYTGSQKYREQLAAVGQRSPVSFVRDTKTLQHQPASPKRATSHSALAGSYREHYSAFTYEPGYNEGHGQKSFGQLNLKEWER